MRRHPANPLIVAADVPPSDPAYRVRGAFNPGACTFGGETLLLLRVSEDVPAGPGRVAVPMVRFEDGRGVADVLDVGVDDPGVELKDTRAVLLDGREYTSTLSHLRLARSADGVNFAVDPEPFLFPATEGERFGVEDARVTRIGDTYWINFTVVSGDGFCTALASTTDWETVARHGVIFPPANKDVSLFPAKCGGDYFALHRPDNESFGQSSVWTARSPDLLHWGDHRCILRPRAGVRHEGEKIGGGPPSFLTPAGWLQVYHGRSTDGVYALFAALLDRDDPTRVLARGTRPVLEPEADYELEGFYPGIVFANGLTHDHPPDEPLPDDAAVRIYYGACDGAACLAETTAGELVAAARG